MSTMASPEIIPRLLEYLFHVYAGIGSHLSKLTGAYLPLSIFLLYV